MLCLGAPLGDAIHSYIKRRKGIDRGGVFLFWDQNDFIIAAMVLTFPIFPLKWYYIVNILLFAPLVTVFANIIGYYIGKKTVPY